MSRLKQTRSGDHRVWLLLILTLLLTVQCNNSPPPPPLPTSPAGPVIRVALLSPVRGELATFGRMLRNGTILAFEEWNDRGGLLEHPIEWDLYHTDCQAETVGEAVQQALGEGHQFIVGPLCSNAAIIAAPLAEANNVLMIAPAATHPLVTVNQQGETRPTIFRASHAYPAQGQAAARFAYDTLQTRRAALLVNPRTDYAPTLADAFARQFANLGGEIVYRATYDPGQLDFTDSLIASQEAGAQIIYLPANPPVVNRLAAQLKALNSPGAGDASRTDPILLGSDSWESPELDLAATDGSYFTTHFALEDPRPSVQTWVERYKAAYAVEPDTLAVLGYEAASLLAQAVEQAGTFAPYEAARTLEQETFKGVTGQISFDRHHNPIKPVPVLHIRGGQTILTSP